MATSQVGIPQGTNYREDAFNAVNQKYIDSGVWAEYAKTLLTGFIADMTSAIGDLNYDDILAEIGSVIGVGGAGLYNVVAFSDAFTDALKSDITDKLANNLGDSIAAWEQAIYDRAVTRQELDLENRYNEATQYFSSRGWDEPPGAASAKITEINKEIDRARVDIQNTIIEQSGKIQIQFALGVRELGVKLSALMVEVQNKANELNLQGAGYVKDLVLKRAEIQLSNVAKLFLGELETLRGNAQISAQLIASALNGVNVSANYGFQGSVSSNHAYDETKDIISEHIQINVSYDQTGAELPPSVQ